MSLEEEYAEVDKHYSRDYDDEDPKDRNYDGVFSDDNSESNTADTNSDSDSASVSDEFMDLSFEDTEEKDALLAFFVTACCNQKCNNVIPKQMVKESRNNFLQLEKYQQDLVILSKIDAGKVCNDFQDAYRDLLDQKQYGDQKSLPGDRGNIIYCYCLMCRI